MLSISFGKTAQSQDTLRLFGHQRTQNTNKQAEYTKVRPRTEKQKSEIQALTGPGRNIGFYVGFHTDYSQISGYDALGVGGSIAFIANHGLAIGFAGKGFFTELKEGITSSARNTYSGGYGGLLIEPVLFPKSPVHLSFPVILGAGGIAKSVLYNYYYPYEYTQVEVEDAEAFLVAEPGVELELNVARWLRLGLGCSYRFTTDLEPVVFDTDIMDGLTAGFSLKFGKF
jgi:hypothetical protein